ncbi:MAG: hypothetical protein IT561_23210 [Alphaproteobacteria bacterium]|nr:hypothetical protein [Alphaproteobacteria bacterium]
MSAEHRYPPDALWADYGRAGIGLAATAGPLLLVPVASWIAVAMGALAVLFAVFAWRTFERQRTRVALDESGIAATGGRQRRIEWAALADARLRYYSTRRDRAGGWMHLRLEGPGGPIRIDSTIADFGAIAQRVADEVRARDLPVDDVTRANFRALGAPVDDQPATGAPPMDVLPADR